MDPLKLDEFVRKMIQVLVEKEGYDPKAAVSFVLSWGEC